MSNTRSELHSLIDQIPEVNLSLTRRLLEALTAGWDVANAASEGEFTEQAQRDVEAAEAYFDRGGPGIRQEQILEEFDLR